MTRNKLLTTVHNALFVVLTMVLGFFGRLSVFPVFPFLKLDISDVPVFIATIISGIPSGVLVLFVSSLLRTLLFSSSGWVGFVMRMVSIIVVLFLGWFCKEKTKTPIKVLGITLGMTVCLIVKLYVNYFFWTNFFMISTDLINGFMISIILPYNLIKLVFTVFLAFIFSKPVKKILNYS